MLRPAGGWVLAGYCLWSWHRRDLPFSIGRLEADLAKGPTDAAGEVARRGCRPNA